MSLGKNILATIIYYDCLNYPLTVFEVWKYMLSVSNSQMSEENISRYSLNDVIEELSENVLRKHVDEYRGYYFLRGRKNLVEKRISNNKLASIKMKRLRRVVWFLRFVPYVKMIGVTGRLAMKNTESASDWDLLVVLKNGKIWTGRTLVTLVVHLLGKRRYENKIRDRVCLNYFITDESLEISTKDMFSANEYFFMLPLFDLNTLQKFQLKNKWIRELKPSYGPTEEGNSNMLKDGLFSKIIRKSGEIILDWKIIENWLKKWQKERIMKNPKTNQEGGLIQASDEALVFLPDPQGPKIFDEFKKKINSLTA